MTSAVGKGTIFKIYFQIAEKNQTPEKIDKKTFLTDGRQNMNILVVEDNLFVLEFVKQILDTHGFNTTAVRDGREAMKLIQENQYQLVLTDCMMPEIHGREIADFTKQHSPDSAVLLMTGYDEEYFDLSQDEDVNIILKPFTTKILIEKIVEVTVSKCGDGQNL